MERDHLGRGNQEFLHCLEQQTLLLTPFTRRPGGKPRTSQPALNWRSLLLSPLPDTTQHSITPRFHDLLYALSATCQARGPVSSWIRTSEHHCVLLNPSPGQSHSSGHQSHPDLDIPPTAFGLPFLFLRAARLTCLPDKSGRVTAQLRYPLRSIQSLL